MGIIVQVFEAVIAGYAVAVFLYLCLSYVVTRLGRNMLMNDDRMNPIYFVLMSISWVLAAAAGAFLSFNLPPFGITGSWIFTLVTGLILIAVLNRNHAERKHQQSPFINVLFSFCILSGCVAGDLLRIRSLSR